jgi:hypothetical protein
MQAGEGAASAAGMTLRGETNREPDSSLSSGTGGESIRDLCR